MRTVRTLFPVLAFVVLIASGCMRSSSADVTYQEYNTPNILDLPPGAQSPIVLVDDLTGLHVPLTGAMETTESGRVSIHLPQLPMGRFVASWEGGEFTVDVSNAGETSFDYSERSADDTNVPYHFLLLAAGFATGLLVFKRSRKLSALAAIGTLLLSAGVWRATTEPRTLYGQVAWDACNLEANGDAATSCKVNTLLEHIDDGQIPALAALVASNNDPLCHEVVHRVGFHTWRTTRDMALAQSIMVPGCDNGLIHGIVESMATFTEDEEFPELLLEFCGANADEFAKRACLHGGGHATIWRTNGDITRAWELCEKLPTDRIPGIDIYDECMGSSVMEWADRWEEGQKNGNLTVLPKIAEPMELCRLGPDTFLFKSGCYMGTNHRTGTASNAARWCGEKEPAVNHDACFSAIGENLPYFELPLIPTPDIKLVPSMALNHSTACSMAPTASARDACMTALSRVFVSMRMSKSEGNEVCRAVSRELVPACLKGILEAETSFRIQGRTLS